MASAAWATVRSAWSMAHPRSRARAAGPARPGGAHYGATDRSRRQGREALNPVGCEQGARRRIPAGRGKGRAPATKREIDLVIRRGLVVDGTGGDPVEADV